MKYSLSCAAISLYAFLWVFHAQAEESGVIADEKTEAICKTVRTEQPPPSDFPTKMDQELLTHCESENLYYGIDQPADPIKARLCAFIEQKAEKDNGAPDALSGSHMLMMIYANGRGATQNIPYAMNLACLSAWAPAEKTARIEDLMTRQRIQPPQPFDYCDGITSGVSYGICAYHQARIENATLDQTIAKFQAQLADNAQNSFQALLKKQSEWADATSSNEIDFSGTARDAEATYAEQREKRTFVALLINLQKNAFPKASQQDRLRSDRVIKTALAQLKKNNGFEETTVSWHGISIAQKTWEFYRDAWGNFAEKAYPAWGKQRAEAWISMQRADDLHSMASSYTSQ